MRIIFFVLCVIGLYACSGKKSVVKNETPNVPENPVAQVKVEPTEGLEAFLRKFEMVLINHDKTGMMELMDRDYKIEQHDKLMKGNTEQFIDAFFCSYQTNGQGYKCIKFNDINEVKRIEILPNDPNYTVVYHISGKGFTIKIDNLVIVKKQAGKTVYGFYGASG